ncbi:uncharacterized protein [Dysidea avara]|uniref:uncharacterized protein isoform X2 n=1 Tax=Dysidea avara TaxID=196820 RepID=UPI003331FF9D
MMLLAGTSQLAVTRQPNQLAARFGLVYLPKKTLFRQVYHKYWCELHRESNFYPKQLVLYELSEDLTDSPHPGKVLELIPLDKAFKVSMTSTSAIKGKYVFKIVTAKQQHLIAVNTLSDASSWVNAINDEFFGPPVPGVVYEYRVAVCDYKRRGTRCNNYVLRVYDDKIKLFTANGKIAMNVSYKIKDIHNIKYQPATTKQYKKTSLTFSIKNAETCYQEKDVLTICAKSRIDLVRVVYHRKRLVTQNSSKVAFKKGGSMSRAKSVDVVFPDQRSPVDVYPVNEESDLSVKHCSLYSQLNSQADHILTSQADHILTSQMSYQQKLLQKHPVDYQFPPEVSENEGIISSGLRGVRRRSKSHELILIHNQAPVLPPCKIFHDSQQHCTSHCRSSSLQDVSFTECSCNSLTQRQYTVDDYASHLVKKQNNSFQMSNLLLQCKAESVPDQLHQELPQTNQSNRLPSRCRFALQTEAVQMLNFFHLVRHQAITLM